MTWNVGGIRLNMEPEKISRRVIRKEKVLAIDLGFPNPFDSIPQKFELTFSGYIFPEGQAIGLWEKLKNAESESIKLVVSDSPWLDGTYSAEKIFIDRDRPLYTFIPGYEDKPFKVYRYSISLAEYSKSDIQDGEDGGPEGDENTNFFDIPETAGLNDLSTQDAIDIFLNVFTLGAIEP